MSWTAAMLARIAAMTAIGLLCSGCKMAWPPAGGGGMADHRWDAYQWDAAHSTPYHWDEYRGDAEHVDDKDGAPAPPPGLYDRLTCTMGRMAAVHQTSARTGTHTGEVALLDVQANRARREFAGTLYNDSEVTLTELNGAIDAIRAGMDLPPDPSQGCV